MLQCNFQADIELQYFKHAVI